MPNSRLEDLKLAIQMGRYLLERQRSHLAGLMEIEADAAVIAAFRIKLELSEGGHAEDLAEMERLTTT